MVKIFRHFIESLKNLVSPSAKPPLVPGERLLKAFISSVMKTEYQWARDLTVKTFDKVPYLTRWAFEYTPGGSVQVNEHYLRHVRESDLVVWLVTKETTEPVNSEVMEALASDRRLWVVLLEKDNITDDTKELLKRVGLRSKWIEPDENGGLEQALELALSDEIVRAMRTTPGLGRLAQLEELGRISRARCIALWQAAGVVKETAIKMADDMEIGNPLEIYYPTQGRPLKILTGELGSGKTLTAERVYQQAIIRARDDTMAPIPIFLKGVDIERPLYEHIEKESKNIGNPKHLGCVVIIDGIDEAGVSKALNIINQARTVVESFDNIYILITTRALPELSKCEECVQAQLLEEADSRRLVNKISDEEFTFPRFWSLPDSIRDSIRRPLIAILLGSYYRRNSSNQMTPTSISHLISDLVENAIGQQPENEDTFHSLCLLAAQIIKNKGSPIPSSDLGSRLKIKQLNSTRLIIENSGNISFPLPILTQWFGAESLREGITTIEEIIRSPSTLDDWRYSLIIAVGNFSTMDVRRILKPLIENHPSFASQILEKTVVSWNNSAWVEPHRLLEVGVSIRDAMKAWVAGLGELSKFIAPVKNSTLLPLTLVIRDHCLITGWYTGDLNLPEISELTEALEKDYRSFAHGLCGIKPGNHPSWFWKRTLEDLRKELENRLDKRYFHLSDGPIASEEIWYLALKVVGWGSLRVEPIPIKLMFDKIKRYDNFEYLNIRGCKINLSLLRNALKRLSSEGKSYIDPIYPGPDKRNLGKWGLV